MRDPLRERPNRRRRFVQRQGASRFARRNSVATEAQDPARPRLLAPRTSLQIAQGRGPVTFATSMILEHVIEELHAAIPRTALRRMLAPIRPGLREGQFRAGWSPVQAEAQKLKDALVAEGDWSPVSRSRHRSRRQDLHQVAADVGGGNRRRRRLSLALAVEQPGGQKRVDRRGSVGRISAAVSAMAGTCKLEGRSALLLGKAKDRNASCAIGPFLRPVRCEFGLDDVRRMDISLTIKGDDGFMLEGRSSMSRISRDPADLASQLIGPRSDTLTAPRDPRHHVRSVADRDAPGKGSLRSATSSAGQRRQARTPGPDRMGPASQDCPRWSSGAERADADAGQEWLDLMRVVGKRRADVIR